MKARRQEPANRCQICSFPCFVSSVTVSCSVRHVGMRPDTSSGLLDVDCGWLRFESWRLREEGFVKVAEEAC